MSFNTSQINFSKHDLQKNIKIPNKLTPELAEIIGLHIGDGCLSYRKDKYSYTLQLMGNPKTEKLHYDLHICKLWKNAFNVNVNLKHHPNGCYGFQVYSKALGMFFNKCLEMPIGKKSMIIGIPDLIKKTCKNNVSEEMICCIRGIIDTDFFLSNDRGQIVLGAWFMSKKLVLDLKTYFEVLGMKPRIMLDNHYYDTSCKKYLTRHRIIIRKRDDINTYSKRIGTNNPNIYKKLINFNIV